MAEKEPFQMVQLTCKPAILGEDKGKILVTDPGNQIIVSAYIKAALNIAEARGFGATYQSRYKYIRLENAWKHYMHATISIRGATTTVSLEKIMREMHIHAEIIYEMVPCQRQWAILYERLAPREHYP